MARGGGVKGGGQRRTVVAVARGTARVALPRLFGWCVAHDAREPRTFAVCSSGNQKEEAADKKESLVG